MEASLSEFFIVHSLSHPTGESTCCIHSYDDIESRTASNIGARGVENDKELKEVGVAQRDNDEARTDRGSY